MLAGSAADVAAAPGADRPAAVDWKVDGARVQIHRDGETVRVFTRTLDDVTAACPRSSLRAELPAASARARRGGDRAARRRAARAVPGDRVALRLARERDVPLRVLAFDLLHRDGEDLLDRPLRERAAALDTLVPEATACRAASPPTRTRRRRSSTRPSPRATRGSSSRRSTPPTPRGARASGWLKVKPVHTLDLVVLAAEWGHGRRRGRLSNLHLGARDGAGFAMVGKTFKGLTDALLAWQTEALLDRKVAQEGITVHVRPELVVEVAVDGVQTSTPLSRGRGAALRRVRRYRDDKTAAEADDVATVLALRT
jgi:DNA ligase-1